MITKPITASCLKDYQTITIGRQMEDNHRQFVFDCSGFDEEVTSIELVHQRSEDVAPYPVTTSSTETLTWTVTDTDTAYAGDGRAELRIRFANGMAKTAAFKTSVIASITGDTVIPDPLQSWYDALIEYIDEHAASPEQIEAAVEAYLEEHPIPAPVTSVNAKTGAVVLTATDVGAMPSSYTAPVTSVNTKTGDVVLTASDVGALSDQTTIPTKTSELTNDSGFITSAPVTSVNSKTGAVELSAADVGAYTKPSGGIPKTDLASAVQASLNRADTALQSAPVTSVNSKVGAVTLNASDVGAMPSSYVAPVTSVDGQTGNVQIMPNGGTAGQVLTKTASGTAWQTPSAGGSVDSVNGQTGTVVLDAEDVGALPDTTVIPTKTSDLTNDSGFITSADDVFWCTFGTTTSAEIEAAIAAGQLPCVQYNDYTYVLAFRNSATNHRFVCFYGGKEKSIACQSGTWIPGGDLTFLTTSYTAPVTSVNGQTGAVVLEASDVGALPDTTTASDLGAYVKPSGGIPKTDLASAVQTSLGKADTALQTAPVTSVNGATGAVVIANATTSAAGLMSATDKSHLDDVYADYSSALTALGVI